jgi:hypothetical protein
MLQLSRSRMSAPVASVVALLAFVAPAFALPPEVTLTSPEGRQATNPPAFAGTAGTKEWESREIAVDVWAGDTVADKPLLVADAMLDRETGAFGGTLPETLPDGTYTARARQRNSEQETGYSAPLVFIIGAPPAEATPTPTPTMTPEASPTPVAAVATPQPMVHTTVQPSPYVCRSRRNFTKHVFRPYGRKLRIVATIDGRPLKSIITGKQILIPIDLRGEVKDTYTLRVKISRTRDGKRITTTAVERIDYHTCIPTKPGY